MILKGNKIDYEWQADWAGINGDDAFSHGGMALDSAGNMYLSFNSAPYIRVFDKSGTKIKDFELTGDGSADAWVEATWIDLNRRPNAGHDYYSDANANSIGHQ